MSNSNYEEQIKQISSLIVKDNVSPDEQDPEKLKKFHEFAKTNYSLNNEDAIQLVFEALVYLKLHSSDSIDPLQDGDQFGAGFS
jgi:hypothetical protein